MESDCDIAIIGMACRFPGAPNADVFWQNLVGGVESITRLSDDDLVKSGATLDEIRNPHYVKAAAILEDPGMFDSEFFGITPAEARIMDPQHRLMLELAHESLEDAACDPFQFRGRIGVFAGAALNTYLIHGGFVSRLADEYIPTLIANDKDFLSTRVSYKLNLTGPSITVQTACSTSAVAVHLARQSLLSGETDLALAGAISVKVPHKIGYLYESGGVLSAQGHVRAFDANADGTVFGSGGGIVVLKRLSDAIANRDSIYAIIKGSAVNNDGALKAGYTAPSVEGQAEAVIEALGNAGVDAETITYLEAHGSGTLVGDPIEIRALTQAFRASTDRVGFCPIGSVKTNVGHLDAAAGIASIIKTALSLKHRKLPPSLNYLSSNPDIDFGASPFYVNTRLLDWKAAGPLRAGVMSTGMGGTNAHLVLEEAPAVDQTASSGDPKLFVLSTRTDSALKTATSRLAEYLNSHPSANLDDVAYSLQSGRRSLPSRKAFVCASHQEAIAILSQENSRRFISHRVGAKRGPLVLLLPGVGDQYVGMGHDLYERGGVFKQEVDRCAEFLLADLGVDIREVLYPKTFNWKKKPDAKGIDLRQMLGRKQDAPSDPALERINQTLYAQPALFTIEYALACLWQHWGANPEAIVGHSMGEYVAACLAGVLSLRDALRLIVKRAQLVSALPTGAMLAVSLPEAEVLRMAVEDISIALINGPGLCVVAGPPQAVSDFKERLDLKGVISRPVRNAHAFHSKMLDPIVPLFEKEVARISLRPPTIPYFSNVTGKWILDSEATDPSYWANHARTTARFEEGLRQLWQLPHPTLLEAGPGRTLGMLALQHPARSAEQEPVIVSSLRHDYENFPDVEFILKSVGKLWVSGVEINWDNLQFARRRKVSLPTYPFERRHYWLEATAPRIASPSVSIEKKQDLSHWFYLPTWKRVLPRVQASPGEGIWLVLGNENPFVSKLTSSLVAAGCEVISVEAGEEFKELDPRRYLLQPGNAQHYDHLIQALQRQDLIPGRVLHSWSLGTVPSRRPDAHPFNTIQERGFYSLIFLAQALSKQKITRDLRLFLLSDEVQDVLGTERISPEKATVLGPVMVIPQEYANIRTKAIDLVVPSHPEEEEQLRARLLGEFLGPDAEVFVAYRNGERWIQSYEPVTFDVPTPPEEVLRKRGAYLITGGLGEIGFEFSKRLAQDFKANLFLVGRAQLPSRDTWDHWLKHHAPEDPIAQRIARIQELEKLGADVTYWSVDVADLEGMRLFISELTRRGVGLNGVIHGAGIVGEKGIHELTAIQPSHCEPHFNAKTHALSVLEEVLRGQPLDFCMLVSSLTPILGGLGEVAYTASNLFMDAFARRQNRLRPAVPWISVNWDAWRFDESREGIATLGKTLQDLGITPDEGWKVLPMVLRRGRGPQLVVSTGDLNSRIRQWIKLDSLRSAPSDNSRRAGGLSQPSPGNQKCEDETERVIAHIWEESFGLHDLGPDAHFGELGGHSLLAIRIVAELRRAFQLDLPIRVLFDHPTISGLADWIREKIVLEIESLSEGEAKQMLQASGGPDGASAP